MDDLLASAHKEMLKIEAGEIKNPDEQRQVTHFTDRLDYIDSEQFNNVESFFADLRAGTINGSTDKAFESVIINGIGGSALGPQFLQFALRGPYWNEASSAERDANLKIYFTDNTDPAGLTDILKLIDLETNLMISISKSGGTRETRNNMDSIEAIYKENDLDFAQHAAAVTMEGSKLDNYAEENDWLKIWPMADSIGGRTSETAIVGHVPAAATGIDFESLLKGACLMDEWTREENPLNNPAYLLAASWFLLGNGSGEKNMVIVPYSDRLVLLSKYLQQLVMESLGKEFDLDGKTVYQGLTVFGNKGGTDAHAYIQQLNDGSNDFFITFIEVLENAAAYPLASGLDMGDYLHNFMQGLSNALHGNERSVIRLTVEKLSAESIGLLIALYERAVAVYAELINVNAFHQPGVEAYKKISESMNELCLELQSFISDNKGFSGNAAAVAEKLNKSAQHIEIDGILSKFAVNNRSFGDSSISRSFNDNGWTYIIA